MGIDRTPEYSSQKGERYLRGVGRAGRRRERSCENADLGGEGKEARAITFIRTDVEIRFMSIFDFKEFIHFSATCGLVRDSDVLCLFVASSNVSSCLSH